MSDKPPSSWTPDDSATEIGPPQAAPTHAEMPVSKTGPNPFEAEQTLIPPPPRPTRDDPVSAEARASAAIQNVPTRINRSLEKVPSAAGYGEEKEITTSIIPPISFGLPTEPARWPWFAGAGVGVLVIGMIAWSLLSDEPASKVEFHPPLQVTTQPAAPVVPAAPAQAVIPPPAPAPTPPPEPPQALPLSERLSPAVASPDRPSDEMDIGGLINSARGNLLLMHLSRRDKRKVSAQLEALNNKRMAAKDPHKKLKAEGALRAFIKKHKLG